MLISLRRNKRGPSKPSQRDSKVRKLKNGGELRSIEDVKFHKGKDGSVVIEVRGSVFVDVDFETLKKNLTKEKKKAHSRM